MTRMRAGARLGRNLIAAVAAAATAVTVAAIPAQAADPDVVTVDLAVSTGEVKGGASGMLYGLSDEGVPTDAIIAGALPRNVTQKAPYGEQHPNGDPLEVEDSFFRNGGEYILTNIQDYYPDWPYNGGRRPADFNTYLEMVRTVTTAIVEESDHPEKYMFVPFNEPDGGNWYGNWGAMKDTFLADWSAAYAVIKDVYPEAKIAGPGDSRWQPARTRDFLTYAKANDVVPDMFTWHELGINNLSTYRNNYNTYRQMEIEIGIDPLPINITEYAMRRDMSVPGQIVQWLAMFEDTKVDAQTAYWTYAGNLNDNMAKNNSANGAWWLLKWYGDLTGETVALTPPELNKVDSLQGIAALDEDERQATVLFGGTNKDIRVDVENIDPAVFGTTVDVQVREAEWSGQEGEALAPPVTVAERVAVVDGELQVEVPGGDRLSAYQLVITPALAEQPTVDATWRASIEAEDTVLRDVTAYDKPMSNDWEFAASGQRDVGGTNRVTSSLTWTLDVPTTGTYRFGSVGGVNGPNIGPGRHALFVDGVFAEYVDYEAGFSWGYRSRAEALVDLEAGTRSLSLRTSQNGTSLLPGSDISLDKFDLELADEPDSTTYPAHLARIDGGEVSFAGSRTAGYVGLDAGDSATFYAAGRDTGYYDVTLTYRSEEAAAIDLLVNGRAIEGLAAEGDGTWTSTATVHLAKGINELAVSTPDTIKLASATVTRAEEADEAVFFTEAEDTSNVTTTGAVRAEQVPAPTNVSGTQLGWIGDGPANTAVLARPEGFGAGQYNLVVRYANAEKNTGHDYNTDVITRFLDITEVGGDEGTRGAFRHNYSWKGFWSHTVGVDLTTVDGGLTLSNATGSAPNIDWLELAPLVVDVSNDVTANVDLQTLEVATPPTTTGYVLGTPLDLSGLVVEATYTDGSIDTVPWDELTVSGYNPDVLGEQVVTLALTAENTTREATFTVVVRDRFVDVADDNQFALEINWLAARGISTGWTTPAGQEFRPVTPIARDAMAAFIYRLAGSPAFEEPETSPFVDVAPGDQFYREITWLAEQEITTGWSTARGAEFRPLAPIARDAMAAFLYRYADEPAITLPETSPFTDVTPSTQFYTEIAWMGEAGISTGFQGNDGTAQYQPLGPVNRDAMAAFLFRYQGYEDQLS
ncbi:bacterial Ig-like domain-containing protein [Serinibacter arcticus]|nr:bacterial Ig-like domain-containing protein [Serinibacter arcticus]